MLKLVCFIYKQIYCDKLDDKHVINSHEQVSEENILGNNFAQCFINAINLMHLLGLNRHAWQQGLRTRLCKSVIGNGTYEHHLLHMALLLNQPEL